LICASADAFVSETHRASIDSGVLASGENAVKQ